MADPSQFLIGSLVALLIPASLAIWAVILGRWRRGEPLVPSESRESVPWRAWDLYIVLILYVALQVACAPLVIGHRDPDQVDWGPILLSNMLASLATLGVAMLYLHYRAGANARDFGFLPPRVAYDLKLGFLTFVAALVPVFTVQYLATRLVPSEHPVQKLLTEDSSLPMFLLCSLTAVVVAPLTEEFLFRVILQGWMEGLTLYRRQQDAQGMAVSEPAKQTADGSIHNGLSATIDASNPYAAPQVPSEPPHPPVPSSPHLATTPPLMPVPILCSSLAFAVVHIGHGPDPLPLFLLAIMLGYLYQKTHRIWPSLLVHACLNAWSLAVLWIGLRSGLVK